MAQNRKHRRTGSALHRAGRLPASASACCTSSRSLARTAPRSTPTAPLTSLASSRCLPPFRPKRRNISKDCRIAALLRNPSKIAASAPTNGVLKQSAEAKRLFPVKVEETNTAGVRTDIITPLDTPAANRDRVLINLHGGGFNSDSGSLIEGVPIANLAKIKVVSVYYRLAPENPFPAAVDDVVAVYKELLKAYKPKRIGIFGTSAGATLTAEVASKLKQAKLPMPGALGMFSVHPDYSRPTDSQQIFALEGLPGRLSPRDPNKPPEDAYAAFTDRKDPVLSPIFADLKGWPPSLLVTSTRDILLSDTTMFHLALTKAGVDAQLLVYEALPHAFWYHYELPETTDALNRMAKFFVRQIGEVISANRIEAERERRKFRESKRKRPCHAASSLRLTI